MNIFQSTTWNGYELWFFKVSIFALGILVGIYFTDICRSISTVLWLIGGIGTVVTTLLWWGKISKI
jgi:hypothetical protein